MINNFRKFKISRIKYSTYFFKKFPIQCAYQRRIDPPEGTLDVASIDISRALDEAGMLREEVTHGPPPPFVGTPVKELQLIHWGRMTHIFIGKLTNIGSDNGLSPRRRQAIISTNDGILSIGTLGTNFSEIFIEIQIFSFKKICLKLLSAKFCPFRLSLSVLTLKVLNNSEKT